MPPIIIIRISDFHMGGTLNVNQIDFYSVTLFLIV